jgi:hypothetical protein
MQSGAVRNRLAHTMVAGLFWLAVGGATEARASLSDSKMSPDMVPGCASSVSMRFIDHACVPACNRDPVSGVIGA